MEKILITKDHSFLKLLPNLSGVYLYFDKNGKTIYVGKSINIKTRVESYFGPDLDEKTFRLMLEAYTVSFIPTADEFDALILEANLIKKYQPKYNLLLKDSKFFPFIKITIAEKIPRILIVRKVIPDKNLYFGPFPSSQDVNHLLRYLRKLFPFCTHIKPYKSCLYVHLSLCPCPIDKNALVEYQKTIKLLSDFLSGKKNRVIRSLNTSLSKEIKKQNFELAGKIKNQLDYIMKVKPFKKSFSEDDNFLKTHKEQQEKLAVFFQKHTYKSVSFHRIEAFDISNLSGKNATASMVVFQNGVPAKEFYRRFKIRTKNTPDDYAMLKEAIARRMKHPEWGIPDLILIDGGIGQVNACLPVIRKSNTSVIVAGLAKRLETIVLENGIEINLPPTDPALHLLQYVRDEAHRFAKRYHHLLRRREFLGKMH